MALRKLPSSRSRSILAGAQAGAKPSGLPGMGLSIAPRVGMRANPGTVPARKATWTEGGDGPGWGWSGGGRRKAERRGGSY